MTSEHCLLCEGTTALALVPRMRSPYVVCPRCGFVWSTDAKIPKSPDGPHYTRLMADIARSSNTMKGRAASVVDWITGQLPARPHVVEVASVDLTILAPLREMLPGRLRGVDANDLLAEVPTGAELRDGSFVDEPVDMGSADLILLDFTLQRFRDPAAALARVHDLLSPSGLLYLECTNLLQPHPGKRLSKWLASQGHTCLTPSRLVDLLEHEGFEIVRHEVTTSNRVLARRVARPPTRPWSGRTDYARVLRALLWHEVRYWPPYIVRRMRRRVEDLRRSRNAA